MLISSSPLAQTLHASGLSYSYGGKQAVSGVSLTLRKGEVLGLLGPNGAGKSTTLQMLAGILAPQAGRIEINGVDLAAQPLLAKQGLGYLPDIPPLYPEMTVDEYLRFAARLHGVKKPAVATALSRVKERCGLTEMGSKLIASLSKGYQQRVGIAQAIVHEPPLVILDEPTNALDPLQIREVRALVRQLAEHHSVLFSSHTLAEVEAVCDRVAVLHGGRLVADEPLATLQQQGGLEALFMQLTGGQS